MGTDGEIKGAGSDNGCGGPLDDKEAREAGVPATQEPRQAVPVAVGAGLLPNKAAEDDPRRWGDQPNSYDHDSWLQEQKPPHWN